MNAFFLPAEMHPSSQTHSLLVRPSGRMSFSGVRQHLWGSVHLPSSRIGWGRPSPNQAQDSNPPRPGQGAFSDQLPGGGASGAHLPDRVAPEPGRCGTAAARSFQHPTTAELARTLEGKTAEDSLGQPEPTFAPSRIVAPRNYVDSADSFRFWPGAEPAPLGAGC